MLHPLGAPEVFLEGAGHAARLCSPAIRTARGRCSNALDRLAGSYDGQAADRGQDLAIAQGQLRDYEARLGQPFAHEAYLAELTDLTRPAQGRPVEAPPGTRLGAAAAGAELAERIKHLKAAHTIDAAPQRTAARRIAAEEPVTARIRRRIDPPLPEPTVEPEATAAEPRPAAPIAQAEPVLLTLPAPARPKPTHRDRITREKPRQLSLF